MGEQLLSFMIFLEFIDTILLINAFKIIFYNIFCIYAIVILI